jgi:hypothetical protein
MRIDLPHPRELAIREESEFLRYRRELQRIFDSMPTSW